MKSFIATASAVLFAAQAVSQSLPQVDLGYEIHQAISFNNRSNTYNFNNIRFAQPPVGDLRFAAPVAPTGRNPVVQNGSFSPICPQALPGWSPVGNAFAAAFAAGNASTFNYTAAVAAAQAAAATAAPYQPSPQETEDCLFLDVVVPRPIFDNANSNSMRRKRASGPGAPVLIWIYGGGYVAGSKQQGGIYNPSGLINASLANGGQGIVYVALNYRLGALGWLSGPSFQGQGGISNAALYDQRLGIEWVKQNIHLFGGDPNQITLIGESAGGGSIMHQITAYGGLRPVSFQRAIPQSPGWLPVSDQYTQENHTNIFFRNLNVSSLAEARAASSAAVVRANLLTVYNANYGSYIFGPTVDGVFVPAQPGLSLLTNISYAKNISVMPGHNTNESPLFAPPYVQTDDQLTAYITSTYHTATPQIVNYIVNTLYPAVYNGTYPWRSPIDRTLKLVTESVFSCNTNYLARAYNNQTHNYQFAVPPALHGQDIYSTFYQGQGTNLSQGIYAPVANALQTYITNFAMTADPNRPSLNSAGGSVPYFPVQGNNATLMMLNYTVTSPTSVVPAIGLARDETVNERCTFWQKSLYT
ncbi:hypothetical protein LTR64_005729 [Lithohypha guttulata]|uniref:Carboxylic ester hydrolase n=1 Tax=Lithohypha guttulata TaxID=1690604 RepID=A0AAN7SVE5_9EURO|nr:hypothetical protein LTR51_002476 [Lithohypha guttulata]KAK5082662.1 hypothetical protein LTR05_006542 [Lithohypha guttulata]